MSNTLRKRVVHPELFASRFNAAFCTYDTFLIHLDPRLTCVHYAQLAETITGDASVVTRFTDP